MLHKNHFYLILGPRRVRHVKTEVEVPPTTEHYYKRTYITLPYYTASEAIERHFISFNLLETNC